ncbi:putative efflux protein, MATE family [Lachnospiraceae bacterium]|nr:putative efflux protein, MATE family [Lachnospiraceae bacterium]
MTKNMTAGKPLPLILRFALPLLLGNLFQQAYNLVDAAIVGQTLGTDALAAVGASSSVQFLVLGFCIGICLGFSIPVAHRFGAGDHHGMRLYIFHGMIWCIITAILLTTLNVVLCSQILHILETPSDIFENAYRYLLVIFLGIPFTLLYNFLSGVLRAVGDSRTPFLFLALSTVLNIILDFFCILRMHWGCMGAGIATVVAQAVSGILCLILIIKKFEILHFRAEDMKWDTRIGINAIKMGLPTGLQYSITAIGSMVMQAANNGLGTVYVSAFTAGMKIKQFAMCPFDALATSVSTFAGQNYGAGKIDRVKKGILQGALTGIVYGLMIGLVLIFGGRYLCMLLVHAGESAVLDQAGKYLRYLGCFYWALGILNVCRMSIQALGHSGKAVLSGVLEMIARVVVSFVFVPIYGFTAICLSDQSAWLLACCYVAPMSIWCIHRAEHHILGKKKREQKV